MQVIDIAEPLQEEGLSSPRLSCLIPDQNPYVAMLFQPDADIIYSPARGLWNANQALATAQHLAFFRAAKAANADLVLVPEYSCPWSAALDVFGSDLFPEADKLWTIGCEGLPFNELDSMVDRIRAMGVTPIVSPPPKRDDGRTYFDPLCLAFTAPKAGGGTQRVVAIQFKAEPMGDNVERFELEYMIQGHVIYKFGNIGAASIALLPLLCSDVLGLFKEGHAISSELARNDDLLLVHLQLNAAPRHRDYARYRALCLGERNNKDVISLNWARNAVLTREGKGRGKPWPESGLSAIYWKQSNSAIDITRADEAHRNGLYITYWKDAYAYAAFLNFSPLVFQLSLTKPSHIQAAPAQRGRDMPRIVRVLGWNGKTSDFDEATAKANLSACDSTSGCLIPVKDLSKLGVDGALLRSFEDRPLQFERLMNLATNKATIYKPHHTFGWPALEALESVVLGDHETIRRLTFAQDGSRSAKEYRLRQMQAFARFDSARRASTNFPRHVEHLALHEIFIEEDLPFVNIKSASGDIGLCVFDALVSDEESAKQSYRVLQDVVYRQKKNQEVRQFERGASFSEPIVNIQNVILWYESLGGDSRPEIRAFPQVPDVRITEGRELDPASIVEATAW